MFGSRKRRPQSDFSQEIQAHIELETERLRSEGLSHEEARSKARASFGNLLTSEERFYESTRAVWFDRFKQDVRDAVRGWHRQPVFTLMVVVTLALGIGGCTAIFSVVDRLLFRSLPYPGAARLVSVGITGPIDKNEFMIGRTYFDWKHRDTPFTSLTSMLPAAQCDLGDQNPIRIHCIPVESNFLKTLGLKPLLGRDFTKQDDLPHAPRVVLISYDLWQSRFAGQPTVLGQTVPLDGEPVRIAAVLPRSFEMPQLGEADILLPEQLDETAQRRAQTGAFLRCFARLNDSLTIEQARAAMAPLFQSALKDVPPNLVSEVHLTLRSLRDRQIHDVRLASWLLLGVVVSLLLISCGNVANLLLARAATTRREMAMRAALGASRFRLMQASLVESVLLALLGATAGCILAFFMVRALIAISPHAIVRLNQAALDGRALLFTLLISVLAAMLFGLAPTLQLPKAESLTGWHSIGLGRSSMRHLLIALQIAISLVLLTGTALFARSLSRLQSQALGMEPSSVLTATFTLSSHRYPQPPAQLAFYRQMEERLAAVPGTSAVALSDSVPPSGGMHGRPFSNLRIEGHPPVESNGGMVAFRYVSPAYFQALQIHITSGRAFTEADRSVHPEALILSQALASKLFSKENPIGQHIALGEEVNGQPVWYAVAGIAADVKNGGLSVSPDPEYYRLRTFDSQQLGRSATVIFRTSLSAESAATWIRREFAAVDPTLPLKIESMRQRVDDLSSQPRFITLLIALFAVFGLLLAAVGLYGVLSFLVGQQTREIGVRMALGAAPQQISALMMRFALRWTALGAVLGLGVSFWLARLIRSLLFEVSPQDPLSFSIALAVLVAAALLASWLPSARAARVDPAISLRHD